MPVRIVPAHEQHQAHAPRRSSGTMHPPSHGDGSDDPLVFIPPSSRAMSGYPPAGPLYPTSRIPPPLQVHHYPVSPSRPHLVPVTPLGAYSMHPPQYMMHAGWAPPPPNRVYPVQPPHPPPPQIIHKVWILDCRACGMFFTNRGMKAVLLLRPNVPLFSTDALPVNCSAYSPTDSSPSSVPPYSSPHAHAFPRTCECLTQTLCCHGCGGAIGYMIVIPCARCTSSTSGTQRATNGHRFVFYAADVAAAQRHYVLGERGVHPFHPVSRPPRAFSPPVPTYAHVHVQRGVPMQQQQLPTSPPPGYTAVPLPMPHVHTAMVRVLSPRADHARMPVVPGRRGDESDDEDVPVLDAPAWTSPPMSPMRGPPPRMPFVVNPAPAHARAPSQYMSPQRVTSPMSPVSPRSPASPISPMSPPPGIAMQPLATVAPEAEPEPVPVPLRAGEALYWHHLVRSGEISAVMDDERARGPPAREEGEKSGFPAAADEKQREEMRGGVPRGMVVGR